MVRNKTGGNKSKNVGKKFSKKIINIPEPDFENSFFGEVSQKPNGLMTNVKLLPIPTSHARCKVHSSERDELFKNPIQVNIGKLKGDKRNSYLGPGDIVQVEINFEMKRKNGNTFAYILCKYAPDEIRQFRKCGMILIDKPDEEQEDIFDSNLNDSGSERSRGGVDQDEDEILSDVSIDDL
jgi:hypothetical protein